VKHKCGPNGTLTAANVTESVASCAAPRLYRASVIEPRFAEYHFYEAWVKCEALTVAAVVKISDATLHYDQHVMTVIAVVAICDGNEFALVDVGRSWK